jgi:hypothetical protein
MTLAEIAAQLMAEPSQDVPFAGMALGGVKKGAAYQAAEDGTLGVPTYWVGGQRRVASIAIARVLGIDLGDAVAAKIEQPAEATPAIPLTALKVASVPHQPAAKAMSARKAPAHKAPAPRKSIKSKSVAAE